jgi:hypothetical protein
MHRVKGLVLSCVGLLAASACAEPPARLIGWWKMDEAPGATTLADSSGYGRDCTLGSGVTMVAGRFGNAAYFDGTASAWARFLSNTDLTNFAFSVWFNVPDAYTNNLYPKIIPFNTLYYQFSIGSPNRLNIGLGTLPTRAEWLTPTRYPSNLKPIVGTMRRSWFGARISNETTGSRNRSLPRRHPLRHGRAGAQELLARQHRRRLCVFGKHKHERPRAMKGALDEVRIYDAALTDQEIFALYQNTPVAIDAGSDQTVYRATTRLQGV